MCQSKVHTSILIKRLTDGKTSRKINDLSAVHRGVFYFQQGLDLGPLVNIVWQNRVLHLPNNIVLETTGMIF
jgi:hypothetical protein